MEAQTVIRFSTLARFMVCPEPGCDFILDMEKDHPMLTKITEHRRVHNHSPLEWKKYHLLETKGL